MKITPKYIFALLLSFVFSANYSQVLPYLDCEVSFQGQKLDQAFVGGVNTPQVYNIDMNLDGVNDLLVFDRDGDVLLPYIFDVASNDFIYDASYQDNFGTVREWMVIRDYNGDGLDDMFTLITPVPGIFVKKGVNIDGQLHMVDVDLGNDNNILYAKQYSTYTGIQVNYGDQPEIVDMDNDGDVDVLNFESGGSYLWYYKNFAVERNLGLDEFEFELVDPCWGNMSEAQFNQIINLSDSPDNCSNGLVGEVVGINPRHSGSCVTVFDEDGDGDMDVLLGDLENNKISFLRNNEVDGKSWITEVDYDYPSYDTPIDITLFNAVFYTDANNDGKRDMLVSPNLEAGFENYNCIWYYENVGSDAAPIFEFRKKDFLVDKMIDFGSQSSPTIVDIDQDGLLDIVMGASGQYFADNKSRASLVLLKNVGTITSPKFEITDTDFLSFEQYSTNSTYVTYSPTFGDLDGDGDEDLIVGDNYGYLFFAENTAGEGNPMTFNNPIYKYMDIQPGSSVKPIIYDLDQDGLGDLIIGELNANINDDEVIGSINFFRNMGTIGSPLFNPDITATGNNGVLGGINPFVQGFTKRAAAPAIVHTSDKDIMIVGSEGGVLFAYDNIEGNTTDQYDEYPIDFSKLHIGKNLTPAFADLNADGEIDMVVGNLRGGLSIFSTTISSGVSASNELHDISESVRIVPNPSLSFFVIEGLEEINSNQSSIRIFNIHNQMVRSIENLRSQEKIDISDLPQGTYVVLIRSGNNSLAKKIVKL